MKMALLPLAKAKRGLDSNSVEPSMETLAIAVLAAVLPGGPPLITDVVAPRFPLVQVRKDAEADFQAFRTFAWQNPRSPSGMLSLPESSVVWHVERELGRRGLTQAADGAADLLVAVRVSPPGFRPPQLR